MAQHEMAPPQTYRSDHGGTHVPDQPARVPLGWQGIFEEKRFLGIPERHCVADEKRLALHSSAACIVQRRITETSGQTAQQISGHGRKPRIGTESHAIPGIEAVIHPVTAKDLIAPLAYLDDQSARVTGKL